MTCLLEKGDGLTICCDSSRVCSVFRHLLSCEGGNTIMALSLVFQSSLNALLSDVSMFHGAIDHIPTIFISIYHLRRFSSRCGEYITKLFSMFL